MIQTKITDIDLMSGEVAFDVFFKGKIKLDTFENIEKEIVFGFGQKSLEGLIKKLEAWNEVVEVREV